MHKNKLVLLLLLVANTMLASVRYVAPTNNSVNLNSIEGRAVSSISEALPLLEPGDTLILLPGIYRPDASQIMSVASPGPYAIVYNLDMSGEPGRPIVIMGIADANGKLPVIDFSDVILKDEENPSGYRITGFLITGSYIHLSDFECMGIQVTRTDHTQSENIRISNGSYNTIENIACHDGMGIGVFINNNSHHNLILNCDAYSNYDPISDISQRTGEGSGGNNDGFGCHVKGGMPGNIFFGCRAWRNSDDGFDLINCYSPADISYCIAIENGFDSERKNRADGNGVKGGGFGMKSRDIPLYNDEAPRHNISHNVAVANKANGIYSNHHLGGLNFSNNTSIANGKSNFSMVNRKGQEKESNVDVDGYGHILKDNLSLSPAGKDILWVATQPSDDEVLCDSMEVDADLQILLAERQRNGLLSEHTISYINSLAKGGRGATFSGYTKGIKEVRQLAGSDAK